MNWGTITAEGKVSLDYDAMAIAAQNGDYFARLVMSAIAERTEACSAIAIQVAAQFESVGNDAGAVAAFQVEQKIRALNVPADTEVAAEYRKRNPLGGPAVVFDSMASRVRAGDGFYAVLKDFGFQMIDGAEPCVLREIVEQLQSCGFECEAGKLENNVKFMELRKLAGAKPD